MQWQHQKFWLSQFWFESRQSNYIALLRNGQTPWSLTPKLCGFESHQGYNMVTFKYQNKQYTTNDLNKKLSKLGISEKDITIMGQKESPELDTSIKLYRWYNESTGESLYSINKNLNTSLHNPDDWIYID